MVFSNVKLPISILLLISKYYSNVINVTKSNFIKIVNDPDFRVVVYSVLPRKIKKNNFEK